MNCVTAEAATVYCIGDCGEWSFYVWVQYNTHLERAQKFRDFVRILRLSI